MTRNGRPVAALLAVRDEEELERLILANSARLRSILERGRAQIRAGEGLGHEEFWREVEEGGPDKRRGRSRKAKA